MTYKISTTSQTEKDVETILLWYLDKSKATAKRFFLELEATKAYLLENPNRVQIRYSNVRVAFLNKFPYGIHFIVEDKSIKIIGVFGTAENPEKWEQR